MNDPAGLDQTLFYLLHVELAHPALDLLMLALTVTMPIAVLFVVARDLVEGRPRAALVCLAATLLAALLSVELQLVLLRPRPTVVRALLMAPPLPSFPSGHAAIVGAFATLLALRATRTHEAGLGRWWRPAWLAAYALLVGVSRVYLGHHYPSDVVIGFANGAAIGALFYGAFRAGEAARPRWSWWLWPQLALVMFATACAYLSLMRFQFLALPAADKVLHFTLYGALSLLLVAFFPRRKWQWTIVLTAAAATIEELLQALSPVRTFDLGDLVCSLGGIFVCGWIAAHLRAPRRAPAAEIPAR